VLTRNITRYMGSAVERLELGRPRAGRRLSVFAVLVLFVLVLLRRFRGSARSRRSAPAPPPAVRAVRLRLHRSRMPVHLRLGVMDVVGRWPTYLLLFFVFAVSAFIMIVPVNSATTANAPGSSTTWASAPSTCGSTCAHRRRVGRALRQHRRGARRRSGRGRGRADGDHPQRHRRPGRQRRQPLRRERRPHPLPLTYADGRAPTDDSEIALSLLALNQAGREVGDTLPVEVGGQVRDLTIVGSYQDITNGGKTAKSSLPTDGNEVMWYMIGVELVPGADAAEAAAYVDQVAPAKVADIEQWRVQTLGPIADRSRSPPSSRPSSRSRSRC
jgi:putative ABC transport system permease protein